jgi:hypothetical protein
LNSFFFVTRVFKHVQFATFSKVFFFKKKKKLICQNSSITNNKALKLKKMLSTLIGCAAGDAEKG